MPKTAYSTQFQGEYDLPQLARKKGYPDIEGANPAEITDSFREWVATDVVCSGCDAKGATVVAAARSSNREGQRAQAHFRFGSANRPQAHDNLCEFYGDKENAERSKHLIDFNKTNSDLTREVRQLICSGISLGVFNQQTMREMRMWFLSVRQQHSVVLNLSENFIRQCSALFAASHISSPPFRESMGSLPGLDWRGLACRVLCERHSYLLEEQRRHQAWLSARNLDVVIRLYRKWNAELTFDPNSLANEYDQAIELAQFINAYRRAQYRTISRNLPPSVSVNFLLALSALLLFSVKWDMGLAIDAFVRIKTAPPPSDNLAGNLIGLNPFHDYANWTSLIMANRLNAMRPNGMDVEDELRSIETELKLQAGLATH